MAEQRRADRPRVWPVGRERRISPRAYDAFHREKFRRPVAKALRFLVLEGFVRTWRKIRSKQVLRRIEADQDIVVAEIEAGGGQWLGFTRELGGALRFHPSLVFEVDGDPDPASVRLTEPARLLLETYLPVPSCPVPDELVGELTSANPSLKPHGRLPPPSEGAGQGGTSPELAAPSEATPATPASPAEGTAPDPAAGTGVYLIGFGAYVWDEVLTHFAGEIRGAADFRAGLMRRHLDPAFPLHEDSAPLLDDVASAVEPLVIIAAYHSDHAPLAARVLEANPDARVFIEKPAAVTMEQAECLARLLRGGAWIDVGYNRRHAAFAADLRRRLEGLPRPWTLTAVVKENRIPPTHWYRWPNQGTRVTGNACHWVDLFQHLVGRRPVAVDALGDDERTSISIRYDDDSLATLIAASDGDGAGGVQEWIEIRGGGTTLRLDDFRRLVVESDGRTRRRRRLRRDKGHAAMYRDLSVRWRTGAPPAYPPEDLLPVCRVTATAADLMRSCGGFRAIES